MLWGSREGDACFLILDHRRAPGAGSCRIELWEATEPLDATATGLLPLADERSGGGEGSGGDSLSRLVTRIAGATAAV